MNSVVVQNGKKKLFCWYDKNPFECAMCRHVDTCKAAKHIRKVMTEVKRKELYAALK